MKKEISRKDFVEWGRKGGLKANGKGGKITAQRKFKGKTKEEISAIMRKISLARIK